MKSDSHVGVGGAADRGAASDRAGAGGGVPNGNGKVYHWTEKFIAQAIEEARDRGVRPEVLFAEMRQQGQIALISQSASIGPTIPSSSPRAREEAERKPVEERRPPARVARASVFRSVADWFRRP